MTSIFTAPIETVQDLISKSADWITWTGAKDATEAKGFIYLIVQSATGIKHPHLLIMNGDKWRADKVGQPNTFAASGSMILRFEEKAANLTLSTDEKVICSAFLDKIGDVLDDLLDGANPDLDIKSISRRGALARSIEEQYEAHGNIVQLEFELEW